MIDQGMFPLLPGSREFPQELKDALGSSAYPADTRREEIFQRKCLELMERQTEALETIAKSLKRLRLYQLPVKA